MKNRAIGAFLWAVLSASCSGILSDRSPSADSISISTFRQKMAGDTSLYRVSGKVISVYDREEGRFYISDGNDFLRIYGMEDFPRSGIMAGDYVELLARPDLYNGEIEASGAICLHCCRGECVGFSADRTDAPWPELPRTCSGDGCVFLHHPSSYGGRNYSVYYDTAAHIARWVAYPLCSSDLVAGERTDAYAFDPLLEESLQASVGNRSYAKGNGGSFIRGHLVPSADRLALNDNMEVFMSCNIVPENSGLNSGAWASMEEYCRKLAGTCDTVYVVAGTDLRGSSLYVKDNVGKRITVPCALYKAVVMFSREKGDFYGGFGAYFDNRSGNPGKFSEDMIMSIPELESKLGKNDYLYKNIFH